MRHLIGAATAALIAAAPALAQEEGGAKIGLISTLSGGGAGLGTDVRDGFLLAVEQAGREGVEVIVEDDQQKPDTPGARARNEALRASKSLGRALWRRLTGYHRRSRAETKMNCIKLLGQKLMACDFDRQTAELQTHVAILNRFTTLGIPGTRPTE